MKMKKENRRGAAAAFFLLGLAAAVGFSGGILLEKSRVASRRAPIEYGDFSQEISLLTLSSVENGIIKGELSGEEMRLIVGEKVFSLFPGPISFSAVSILSKMETIPAPTGAGFVASKRGKYFWPLDAPEAFLIAEKNRIFFENAEAAVVAGFVKKKK